MDYEKKYNEALERAKAAIDIAADKDLVKGVATTIFPELRESEDERIRKELIAFFQDDLRGDYWHDLEVGHILAWLEKQKEQKPAEWSEEDENALKYIHELISWGYAEKFMDAQTAHDMRKWVNEHISHDTFQNGNSRWKPGED